MTTQQALTSTKVASTEPTWHRAIRDLPREHGFEPLHVTGHIPADLRGTLYRTGPSLFSSFGRRYHHWFDGDGAVSAVRFSDGDVRGAVRVVQSRGLLDEQKAQKPLFGGYGTPSPRSWLHRLGGGQVKNTGNTSVIVWQRRLFALMEAGLPTELSPDTLETLGERDLDGVIIQSFSAHAHRIPSRRATYNFGMRLSGPPKLDIYELPDAGKARRLITLPVPAAELHDFIATDRHLIFFVPPLRLRILNMILGRGSYSENLNWSPEAGTQIIIVPIDDPENTVRFSAEPFYQWHFANAFERGSEIVVDYVRYPDFANNEAIGNVISGDIRRPLDGVYHRAVIDPRREKFRSEAVWDSAVEFPRIASRAISRDHQFAYVTADSARRPMGYFNGIAKIDVHSGHTVRVDLGPDRYPSEPVFVRRKDAMAEDDGYLLTLVYDAGKDHSSLVVVDARAPDAGAVAEARFDHHIPLTFHGNWSPA
ncbi:MAG TPA: carotenoid oxygenase family protein [Kofleriaceae bacterium]|nr:carotenoid oxygenase family protein [Kofleriaceae bacterium]